MALRKINNFEMELNFFKDSIWRLTNRVFVLEDFIKTKFGDVLNCCNSKSVNSQKGPKRKRANAKIRKRSPINLRSKIVKSISSSDSEVDTSSKIKTENFSEPYSDEDESDPYESPNEIQFHSPPPTQGDISNNEDEEEEDMDNYIPVAQPLLGGTHEHQNAMQGKTSWSHVKDFTDKETAEAELSSEWALKYTLTDADGTKSTYDCKHEIGTCPAKRRLISLNNIGSVSLLKNNVDHVHSEDAKYGFNFSTKKIIDSLIAQGVTEPEPMMKALVVRNILVEAKFVNRYLGRHKKQLGLFNKSPTAKRLSYTVSFKLQVVGKAEKVGNKEAAREFNIDESNVRNWRKCKAVLEKLEPQRSSLRGKRAKWPDLEKELAIWISGQKEAGEKITTELIRQEAGRIALRLNLSDFSSSKGWLERFTKRLGESFARRKAKKRVKEESTTTPTPIETVTVAPPIINPLSIFPNPVIVTVPTASTTPENVISTVTPTVTSIATTSAPETVPITSTTELATGFPIGSWYVEYVHHN